MDEKKQISMSLGTVAIVTAVLIATLGFAIYFGVQYYLMKWSKNAEMSNTSINNKSVMNEKHTFKKNADNSYYWYSSEPSNI